jgi:hypothetical protein
VARGGVEPPTFNFQSDVRSTAPTRTDGKAANVTLRWTRANLKHCSIVLMCALLAGCTANSRNTDSTDGTLSGQALQYGGPLINGTRASTGIPGQGLLITIEKDGQFVASSRTGPDGDFSFNLPAGTYKITGCAEATVDVRAGQATVQNLTCPIK